MLEFAVMRLTEDPKCTEMILYVMNLLHIDFCPDVQSGQSDGISGTRSRKQPSLRFFLGLGR